MPRQSGRAAENLGKILVRLLAFFIFLGVCTVVSAQQENPKSSAEPQTKPPHPPFYGKSCIDCHKQEVTEKARCLVAKEPMCVLCHDIPVTGGTEHLVKTNTPLCLKCHTKDRFKGSYSHGPFAFGACVACHDPHGSSEPKMLRVSGRQICLTCHRDMDARIANAGYRHRALATGCTDCHSPHTSDQRFELKSPVPSLCSQCHEKTFRGQEAAEVKHSPFTESPSCLNCHNPHLSQNDHLLNSDDMNTCLSCHDEPIKVGQYELARIGQMLLANPMHHGPIQSKECSECHKPHGSSNFRLLTDEYPKESYTPFLESKYQLCFRCHEPTLAEEERTTTATGFRNGDRNLHFVHVNQVPTGRNCRLCHEVHASSLPKHMRISAPFGTWELPIGFNETEDGGSCSPGCHAMKKYERTAG